jgi:hypothetical protein
MQWSAAMEATMQCSAHCRSLSPGAGAHLPQGFPPSCSASGTYSGRSIAELQAHGGSDHATEGRGIGGRRRRGVHGSLGGRRAHGQPMISPPTASSSSSVCVYTPFLTPFMRPPANEASMTSIFHLHHEDAGVSRIRAVAASGGERTSIDDLVWTGNAS